MSATSHSDLDIELRRIAGHLRDKCCGMAAHERWFAEVGAYWAVEAQYGMGAAQALDDLLTDRDPADEIAPDDDEEA